MRPFKEVILFDNIVNDNNRLKVNSDTHIDLKTSSTHVLWRGSIDDFKRDFEIPNDAPLSTRETTLPTGDSARFVTEWRYTTLNFKFNYQIWYKDAASGTPSVYVNGSNNTINLTIPNVLVFNGTNTNGTNIKYYNNSNRIYNPNVFPLPVSITSFTTSNKTNDFQNIMGSGNDSLCYLVFRFGVNGYDIQICLLTKDNNNFQINSLPLVMPYASLTFTGFNSIKRLN